MTNNFILIASNTYSDKLGELSGYDIAEYRLDDMQWPLYKNTPNKNNICKNDNILIYISGNQQYSKSFIAKAIVSQVVEYKHREHYYEYEPNHISPAKIILLKDVCWFDRPVSMLEMLDNLTIVPMNRQKWGCIMHSGCRKLNDIDYDVIIKAANQ